MKNLKIAIGADHGGFDLKTQLLGFLRERVGCITDCGTHSKEAVDYPRIAYTVARLVASGQADRGIMIDGAGIGSAMAANKVRGVRAAACYSVALAKNSREHNDANVLTLGAGQTNFDLACQIVEMFLTSECVEERHFKRVQLINAIQDGPIEVGPHQATLLAGAGEPRTAPPQSDIEKMAKRVQELLAAQGAPVPAPACAGGALAEHPAAYRPHHPAAGHHPDGHRAALPRGAPVQVFLGLCESHMGCSCPAAPGRNERESLLCCGFSAGSPAAGNQGDGSARGHPAGRQGNRHGD